MKKIGIVGGLSCESTAEYYKRITRKTNEYLGGLITPYILMISINTENIAKTIHNNDWDQAANIIIQTAKQLEEMGAESVIIPCNTLHKIADEIQKNLSIPLINIMHCVGDYINKNFYTKVALFGTKFTMEDPFYSDYLYKYFNIQVEVPEKCHREKIHSIIFNELCRGVMNSSSKKYLIDLCHNLDCQSIILGCSELPLLIKQEDVNVNLIDTVEVHSEYIVNFARTK